MPGAGTDKTKSWVERPGPCVDPGRAAARPTISARRRARWRISGCRGCAWSTPREGWPTERACVMASGARPHSRRCARVYDLRRGGDRRSEFRVRHDRARARSGQARGRCGRRPAQIAPQKSPPARASALMFGRERNGLENHEVALADRIITLPVNPGLRLAQSRAGGGDRRLRVVQARVRRRACRSPCRANRMPAPRQQLLAFFANLERELEKVEFFRPPDKRETMQINLRNIFSRMQPTQQDIQTLARRHHGDRRGPQGPGARRRARQRGGRHVARAARRARRRASARCGRAGARACAAAAAQSDRRRARAVGRH